MKNLFLLLLIASIFLSSEYSHASHGMGAEITYICQGSNQYLIKVKLIRDCSGIPANPTIVIPVTNSCGYLNPSLTVNLMNTQELASICPSAPSTCQGGTAFG